MTRFCFLEDSFSLKIKNIILLEICGFNLFSHKKNIQIYYCLLKTNPTPNKKLNFTTLLPTPVKYMWWEFKIKFYKLGLFNTILHYQVFTFLRSTETKSENQKCVISHLGLKIGWTFKGTLWCLASNPIKFSSY